MLKDLVSDLEDLKERYSYFRKSTKTGPDLVNVKITLPRLKVYCRLNKQPGNHS